MSKPQDIFDRLDRLSRARALTDAESALLERVIVEMDGAPPPPLTYGWAPDQAARFFDLIADDVSIREASRRVGKTECAGSGKFSRIAQAYGWQAA